MRGIAFLSAVVLAAEIGGFRRFANPRQLMAWLGLFRSATIASRRAWSVALTWMAVLSRRAQRVPRRLNRML
jgi:transposase